MKNAISMRKKGFTVLELLTVIGIIMFMMAVLTVVFIRMNKQAQVKACQAQIDRIGMALTQYAADFRGQGLPPDTGYGLALHNGFPGGAPVTPLYDSFSLWRYLSQPISKGGKIYGPYVVPPFSSAELTKVGNDYQVHDPWGTAIGYIGDSRRTIHNRDFADIFSCGPDRKTAQDFPAWSGTGNPLQAYNGASADPYGVIGGASLLGSAVLNGTLTNALRIPLRANEVRDDINNWDPQH